MILQVSCQPRDHEGKLPTQGHSGRTQAFCVYQHSIQQITRYSTLYHKIAFVLEDFAQLQANLSVLSMGRPSYDV